MNLEASAIIPLCLIGGFLIVWLVMPWRAARSAAADGETRATPVPSEQVTVMAPADAKTVVHPAPEPEVVRTIRHCAPPPPPIREPSRIYGPSSAHLLIPVAVFLIPIGMLAIALAHLPYGYYQLLKLVVTGASIWIAGGLFSSRSQSLGVLFGMIALAYNPIFPIRFTREIWQVVNVATIIALLVGLGVSRSRGSP